MQSASEIAKAIVERHLGVTGYIDEAPQDADYIRQALAWEIKHAIFAERRSALDALFHRHDWEYGERFGDGPTVWRKSVCKICGKQKDIYI